MWVQTYEFKKNLPSIYYVPGTVVDVKDTMT